MQKSMFLGISAAFLNAAIAIANGMIVFGVIGAEVIANPTRLEMLVRTQPTALLWLEGLKLLAAFCGITIVLVIHQLGFRYLLRIATLSGLLAGFLLAMAGLLGAGAIMAAHAQQAPMLFNQALSYTQINALVTSLGLAALFVQGLWLLQVCRTALRTGLLPAALSKYGLLLGLITMLAAVLPVVALLALGLGLIWSLWLGMTLLTVSKPGMAHA